MMTGDLRYVHPGEFSAFADKDSRGRRERFYEANKATFEAAYRMRDPNLSPAQIKEDWLKGVPLGMLEHQAAWRPEGDLGKWATSNPAVAKIGDSLFVHGGISASYAGLSIDEINRQAEAALNAQNKATTAIINHPQGPLWYRGLISRGGGDEATKAPIPPGGTVPLTIEQEIDLALNNYGVKRIVVAHTPNPPGIISASGGKLWRVDSGNSRAYKGTPSYLEIVGDKVTAYKVPRPAGEEWGS